MTASDAYIVLNMVPGMGPVRCRRLCDFFGSPEAILAASASQLQRVDGVGPELSASIVQSRDRFSAEEERAKAQACGAGITTQAEESYPVALREIHDPPLVLYHKGDLVERDRHAIAIVGSRQTSHYGREMARRLGYQLAYAGWTVVSGLARGIDTFAHEGALAAKGRTLAVLGCGIDGVYPPENEALADKITTSGAVLCEFPVGTKPDRQTFPIRNRVVAGLCSGLVVVEAGKASGALITARMALDQGRQIFAVPGRADTPHAKGCHELIKEGAKLVEDAADVVGELSHLFPMARAIPAPQPAGLPDDCTEEEKIILQALGDEERHLDEVCRISGLPIGVVSPTLLRLELKKRIQPLPGRFFVRLNP